MANIELNIVALGDFTSVSDQITKLKAQVAALNTSLAGATGASFDKAAKSVNALSNEFSNALTASGSFTKQTVQLQTETEKFGQSLQKGTLGLTSYYQILTKQQGAATDSVKALAVEQTKLQNSVIMADPSKQGFYSVFTPKSIDAVANATKIAANAQNIYNIAIRQGANELINWGKNTQWAGRQLTVGLSMPMVLFAQQAVSAFNSVNTALTQFQKVYGEGLVPPSQNSIDQISKQVLDLGRNMAATLGISQEFTVQVASSFAAMGKMGTDLTTMTEQTDRLAKLGNLDQKTATTAVIALQNVYKLSTTQLADAVNYFGAIQKQTSLSMNDLVDAESRVGPIIDQLGGSYKDTAIMLLAMKEAGVPAAQGANALKSAFASIIAPTSAATKEFQKYGINLAQIKNAGGPVQMIQELQGALQNLNPLIKEQLIEKLFGKYQFSRVSALIDNFGKVGSQTANAMTVAAASSDQIAKLANQEIAQATSSPSAQWTKALNTFKADLYPVGQEIMKIATKVLEFGNKIANLFQGLPGPIKLLMAIFAGVTVLAGPILMLTGLMANFVGNILKGVINLKDLVSGGKTMRQLFTPEIVAAQNATDLFAAGLKGDVDQVQLLTQAITDLTDKLAIMKDQMNVGAGIEGLKSAVGATAQVEAGIFSQMSIPGFASGTNGGIIIGPGTGTSDSIVARVSNGETILTAQQTKDNLAVINAIVNGKKIPGFNGGKMGVPSRTGLTGQYIDQSHMAGNFEPGSPEYDNLIANDPALAWAAKHGSVKVTPDLTADTSKLLNLKLRANKGGASINEFSRGWDEGGSGKFVASAGRHGADMSDPAMSQAAKDFDDAVKQRVIQERKAKELAAAAEGRTLEKGILDEDLQKAVRSEIDARKNSEGAEGKFAASLDKASKSIGEIRANAGTKAIKEGLDSGVLTRQNLDGSGEGLNVRFADQATYGTSAVGQVRANGRVANASMAGDGSYITGAGKTAGKNALSSFEKSFAEGLNEASRSASPSKETQQATKNIVDGVVTQIEKSQSDIESAMQNTMTESVSKANEAVQAEQMQLPLSSFQTPDLTPQIGPRMANGGFYSGEIAPGIMGEEESSRISSRLDTARQKLSNITERVTDKFKKEDGKLNAGAKAGIGTALMMGGQMLGNSLPKGSVAGQAVNNMSSYAGMGMMFGPYGAAAGAAIGGIMTVFNIMKQHAAEAAKAWTDATTTSQADLSIFGSTVANTSISTKNMVGETATLTTTSNTAASSISNLGGAISNLSPHIDAMVKAIGDLPTGDPLGDLVKAIKKDPNYTTSGVTGEIRKSVQNAISTGGLKPEDSKSYVFAALKAAGRSSDFGTVWKEVSKAIGFSEKTGKANTAKATTSSLDYLSRNKANDNANGPEGFQQADAGSLAGQFTPKAYKDLQGNAKALADQMKNLYAEVSNGSLSFAEADQRIKGMSQSANDTGVNLVALEQSIIGTGTSDDIKRLHDIESMIKAAGPAAKLSASEITKYQTVLNVKNQADLVTWGKKMGIIAGNATGAQITAAMTKVVDAYYNSPEYKKAMDAANISLTGPQSGGNLGGGTPAPFVPTAQEKGLQKQLEGMLSTQNAQLKIVKDQLSIQQKVSQELKAQMQYQQQINGLQNDARTAMISGDYLQAATIKQQISGAKVDFNATSVAAKMQDQIDKMQPNADAINQALSDLKDLIGNSKTVVPASILAATKLGTVRAQSVSAGIANGAPTVSTIINVTGTVDSTSTTSSHPTTSTSTKIIKGGSKIKSGSTIKAGAK